MHQSELCVAQPEPKLEQWLSREISVGASGGCGHVEVQHVERIRDLLRIDRDGEFSPSVQTPEERASDRLCAEESRKPRFHYGRIRGFDFIDGDCPSVEQNLG